MPGPYEGVSRLATPIRAIVFDFGGVLYTYNYRHSLEHFASHLGITVQQAEAAWESRIAEFERGEIDELTYWEAFRKAGGVRQSDSELHEMFVGMFHPMPESLRIKYQLKGKYLLGMLSNNCAWEQDLEKRLDLREGFDFVMMSYEVGARKPEPVIFEKLIAQCGMSPDEIVFIDDTPAYGEAVRKAGLHFIHFRSAGQLREELHMLQVWF